MSTSNAPEAPNFDKLDGLKKDQNLDKKLQNLVKQIDELRTLDDGNDSIDGVLNLDGELDKGLSKALNKCDLSTIDTLIDAIKNISSNPNLPDDIKKSLTRLEGGLSKVKESREKNQNDAFNKFNKWIGDLARGSYENQHRKKDEISAVVNFVNNDANKAGALNLYHQIQSLDFSKMPRNTDFDNLRTVFNSIKAKYNLSGMTPDKVKDSLGDAELDEAFRDNKANHLSLLAKEYLSIDNWNGDNLKIEDTQWIADNVAFTQEVFIKKFNEVNEARRGGNEELIKTIAIDGSEMNKFSKNEKGELLYDGTLFDVSKMQEVFKDKVDGVLSKGNFLESEGLQAIFKRITELISADVDKKENDRYIKIEGGLFEMNYDHFLKIKEILGDKMFLECSEGNHRDGSYNLVKLKNYLTDMVKNADSWQSILNLKNDTKEGYYKFKAYIAAVQILLNASAFNDEKITLKVDGVYGDSTISRIRNFQIAYCKANNADIYKDGRPGVQTINALLGLGGKKEGEKPEQGSEKPEQGSEKPKQKTNKPKQGPAERPKQKTNKPKQGPAEKPKQKTNKPKQGPAEKPKQKTEKTPETKEAPRSLLETQVRSKESGIKDRFEAKSRREQDAFLWGGDTITTDKYVYSCFGGSLIRENIARGPERIRREVFRNGKWYDYGMPPAKKPEYRDPSPRRGATNWVDRWDP